jgi:uncharacterized protein YpbB
MNIDQIQVISQDLSNWVQIKKVSDTFPQFSYSQIKRLFWMRKTHKGLSTCYRVCAP